MLEEFFNEVDEIDLFQMKLPIYIGNESIPEAHTEILKQLSE